MTFKSLFNDLTILMMFLIAGYLIREFVPLFQKFFLPSAVIGGLLALLGGQQCLGIWTVPKSFSSFSGQLIILIMTALIWGVTIDKKRIKSYLDYMCLLNSVRFIQVFLGAAVGILLRYVWTELPLGWGTMGFSAYFGGHGTVASYAGAFENLGYGKDYAALGMLMATLGLIAAVVVGMFFVNIGVRRGWTEYVHNTDELGKYEERRLLPKEKQKSIGTMKVPGGSINALAFQLAMMMCCIWVGHNLLLLLQKYVWIGFKGIPSMLWGIIGAVIIWPFMCKLHLQEYVDKKTCSQISGCVLEVLILGSIATINLKFLSKFWVPILIHFAVITFATAIICFWYNRKIAEKEWFEKGLFVFGQATGATPTGLALVRAVDPDSVATPGEAHAVNGGSVSMPFATMLPVLLPMLATSMPWAEVALGLVGFLVFFVLGWRLFRKTIIENCGR